MGSNYLISFHYTPDQIPDKWLESFPIRDCDALFAVARFTLLLSTKTISNDGIAHWWTGPRSRCESAAGVRSVRSGAAAVLSWSEDKKTLGHAHSSSLRLRLTSHHLAASLRSTGRRRRTPLLAGSRRGLPLRPDPHTSSVDTIFWKVL